MRPNPLPLFCVNILRRLPAALLALPILCLMLAGPGAAQSTKPAPAKSAPTPAQLHAQAVQSWAKSVQQVKHGAGCFSATYPSKTLTAIPCAPPPPPGDLPQTAPSYGLSDVMAQEGSAITASTGIMGDFVGMEGEFATGPWHPAGNVWSFQMNTDIQPVYTHNASSLCRTPTGFKKGQPYCSTWVQFVYENNNYESGSRSSYLYIVYVLTNYQNTHSGNCPSSAWQPLGGSCYYTTPVAPVPEQTLPTGANFVLSGQVGTTQDTVSLLTADGRYYTSTPATRPFRFSNWHQVQFNIFGDAGGNVANFQPGATMAVQVNLTPNAALTHIFNSTTAESSNIIGASTVTNSSYIAFSQGVAPTLQSISPSSGRFGGGTPISLIGAGFGPNAVVSVGGKIVSASCDSTTHCTAITPPAASPATAYTVQIANESASRNQYGVFSGSAGAPQFAYGSNLTSCQLTEYDCPTGGGTQSYTVNCPDTVAFSLNGQYQSTGTSFSGQELAAHQASGISACLPNNNCQQISTTSTETCPTQPIVHPNPPPITNCRVCVQTGRQCVTAPGGYKCVGNIQ